jgi:hypothetical protein
MRKKVATVMVASGALLTFAPPASSFTVERTLLD